MSGKREDKDKLAGLDTMLWEVGSSRERVGAKRFGMSLETQGE